MGWDGQAMMREIDTSEFHAQRFSAQCRRDARMFPRPNIEDVICKRIVSRDFVSGACDHWSEFGEPSAFLKRQAS
jgi:hypothetical protein